MRIWAMKKQSQNKANIFKDKINVRLDSQKDYENISRRGLRKSKPKQTQFQNPRNEPKKRKEKEGVRNFFAGWVAGKIDFLDGCDILLGKIYGKSQFNLFWRLIL